MSAEQWDECKKEIYYRLEKIEEAVGKIQDSQKKYWEEVLSKLTQFDTRIAVMETKILIYAGIAGFITSAVGVVITSIILQVLKVK